MKLAKEHTVINPFRNGNSFKSIKGKKFSKLTVITLLGVNYTGVSVWECRCDCGNLTQVSKTFLNNKHKKSCGCDQYKKKNPIDVALVQIYHRYKTNAKTRNLEFNLTKKEVSELVFNSCFYCGIKSSNNHSTHHNNYKEAKYNGIDRIDSTKGYIKDNIVSCCKTCNHFKSDLTVLEFITYIDRLAKYYHNWVNLIK